MTHRLAVALGAAATEAEWMIAATKARYGYRWVVSQFEILQPGGRPGRWGVLGR
jgi:hypothetical protein